MFRFNIICNLSIFSCQSVQNLGLAIISMISGMIVDNGGFFMLEIFFIGWLCSKFNCLIVYCSVEFCMKMSRNNTAYGTSNVDQLL